MIKKLRIKFIALAMASLLLVLLVIIGSINILNYRNILSDADNILALLAENGGRFPAFPGQGVQPELHKKSLSPEIPYESRYFSVHLDASGQAVRIDTGKIAAVDADTAFEYAYRVWTSGDERGFVGNYRFTVQKTDGESLIIFLDCGRSLDSFRTFLFTGCWIAMAGLLAVFILLLVFSRRIVRPVSESYEKQKRFITDAGHEIKTPLTVIDADTEILVMEQGENEWLQDIRAQTKRLAALTNDLISLSRMDEDKAPLQTIEFPFSDLVEEMVQSFQALAKLQGKSFVSSIEPMLSLNGDQKALRQLLSILLDNALKYSNDNGSIELKLARQGKFVCLALSNTTAAPVTQEQIDHMFDRFYRADQSRNSQIGGYGIGLSIAKAVVSAHKGKISASMPGEYALKVTVLLPM